MNTYIESMGTIGRQLLSAGFIRWAKVSISNVKVISSVLTDICLQ